MKNFRVMIAVTVAAFFAFAPAQGEMPTGQSFSLETQPLPDGREMTYVCVRGRITDPMIPEIPSRDYGGEVKGSSVEGVFVWLKRNPQLRAITDDNGIFEIVCENGILSPGVRGIDDIVCIWKNGYEYAEQCILHKEKAGSMDRPRFRRDSRIRITDYDATRYFQIKRTANWEKLYGKNGDTNDGPDASLDIHAGGRALKKIVQKNSIAQKPFAIPFCLPDGRVAREINLTGTVTDSKTSKPIPYAGVWLKRNPTMLALTDKDGRYIMRINAVGLRPRTEELTDSLCVSAGAYQPREIPLENYKGEVSFTLNNMMPLKEHGKFIEMVDIPAVEFRLGTGVTQGGGGARDRGGVEFYCWMSYPVRTVSLPAFSIGKYPTTLGQYDKVREWGLKNGYEIQNFRETPQIRSYLSYDPKTALGGLTWVEAIKWCNALSEMEGRTPCYYTPRGEVLRKGIYDEPQIKWKVDGYRFPTRAEWEYAGTAGTHFTHYWPEGYSHIRDHSYIQFDNKEKYGKSGVLFPVGQKKSNPFGLFNLVGNSGEWCWNWQAPIHGDDVLHPKGGTKAEAVAFNRSVLYGYYVPWKDKGGADGWSVGPIWGEIAWDDIRLNWGFPAGHWTLNIRPVISSERGDKDRKLPVLYDRQHGLPKPVALEKITDSIELVDIPTGSFLMGSSSPSSHLGKRNRKSYDERPEHKVSVSAFRMAKYETTLAQWNRVREWALKHGYQFDHSGDKGEASSDDLRHPIVNISWLDVIKWCNAASEMDGLKPIYYMDQTHKVVYRKGGLNNPVVDWESSGYRLPTEAEWEYAAVGGEDTGYYWGDYGDKKYAWFAGWRGDSNTDYPLLQNYAKSRPAGKLGTPQEQPNPKWATHPVGQKIGNRYGLYDVFGNVWEMCWDWAAPYSMLSDDTSDPTGPATAECVALYMKNPPRLPDGLARDSIGQRFDGIRVLKGVGYLNRENFCGPYLSARAGVKPTDTDKECGFRVVTKAGKKAN